MSKADKTQTVTPQLDRCPGEAHTRRWPCGVHLAPSRTELKACLGMPGLPAAPGPPGQAAPQGAWVPVPWRCSSYPSLSHFSRSARPAHRDQGSQQFCVFPSPVPRQAPGAGWGPSLGWPQEWQPQGRRAPGWYPHVLLYFSRHLCQVRQESIVSDVGWVGVTAPPAQPESLLLAFYSPFRTILSPTFQRSPCPSSQLPPPNLVI